MTQSTYLSSSPYYTTPQVNTFLPYLDFWSGTILPASYTDTPFTITSNYQYRPDVLSNDLYGTTGYWWVFARRNPNIIKDPIYDMKVGVTIYLPPKTALPSQSS